MLETPCIHRYSVSVLDMEMHDVQTSCMTSDNLCGADNQQERPGCEQWVVGFVLRRGLTGRRKAVGLRQISVVLQMMQDGAHLTIDGLSNRCSDGADASATAVSFPSTVVGDAVMASFLTNDDALACALDARRAFKALDGGSTDACGIAVKFGLHRGPAPADGDR